MSTDLTSSPCAEKQALVAQLTSPKALVHARLDSTYEAIRTATYGIAFFRTPHQGGNYAGLGDIAVSIARRLLRNPKNTFLEALKGDSLFADDLVKDFRQQLEDYYVLSFYESLSMKKLGVVSEACQLERTSLTPPDRRSEVRYTWPFRSA